MPDDKKPKVRRFEADEAKTHCPAAKTPAQRAQWAKIANRVMNRTHPKGASPEDVAIATANQAFRSGK